MSLTIGIIAIKGNHLENLPEVFRIFKLIDTQNDEILKNWDDATEVINEEYLNSDELNFKRVVWFDNEWTIIEDSSFMLCTDNEALSQLSTQLCSQVFIMTTQGTSGSFGFSYFDKVKIRGFICSDGEIMEDNGTPLDVEKGLNITESVFYDDIVSIGKQLGVDIQKAERLNTFIIKKLKASQELIDELESYNVKVPSKASKPWWKFW